MKPVVSVEGGNKFSQKLKELEERLRKSKVYVGLPKAVGNYGNDEDEDGPSIAMIGAVHEFGSADGVIPERSFLRVPLKAAKKVIDAIIKNELPKVVSGGQSMDNLLYKLGAKGAAISQEAIVASIPPPNAPSTIAGKGGKSTPLIDSGVMKGKITYQIGDKE